MDILKLDDLTPRQIVEELDRYIVGQKKAKRAVAVALRNRIRRLRLPQEVQDDITPKNILMIGPTGVGKTEIARRLAKLSNAPFIKVEATKYTEVGYVGRDVESMIRDLMSAGVQMVKQALESGVREEAERRAEEALLDLLLPGSKPKKPAGTALGSIFQGLRPGTPGGAAPAAAAAAAAEASSSDPTGHAIVPSDTAESAPAAEEPAREASNDTREKFRQMLRSGALDERSVEVSAPPGGGMPSFEVFAGSSIEDLESSISGLAGMLGGRNKKKLVKVPRAREILIQEESEKLIDRERVADEARRLVQERGIVFLDEIDKIASKSDRSGSGEVSREGVQRDILPIVEGSTVNTKWGPVDTTHILFIAAGAFNLSKPSDLIPELQGRFPLRVELESLGKEDFLRILTEPENSLTRQYHDLLATEGVEISFDTEAIEALAAMAAEVNAKLENIGARRLHTIMETLLEELSFEASDIAPAKVPITAAYVSERLSSLAVNQDLGRYML